MWENSFEMSWGKLRQKQKNAQNEGVGVAFAGNSGNDRRPHLKVNVTKWDAHIFKCIFWLKYNLRVYSYNMAVLHHIPSTHAQLQWLTGGAKQSWGSSVCTQNNTCLSMNSLNVRKLLLLVNYAVMEISFVMTQRTLIPRPASRQHPEPGDRSPFIDVLSASLVLFHSKHVKGQTNSYKSKRSTSLFQEGCKQGAKRGVQEGNITD